MRIGALGCQLNAELTSRGGYGCGRIPRGRNDLSNQTETHAHCEAEGPGNTRFPAPRLSSGYAVRDRPNVF